MTGATDRGSGFESYLQGAAQAKTKTSGDRKLLQMLGESQGTMLILDLAAKAGMELFVFMETIRSMQDSGLVALKGSTGDPEKIEVEITSAGEKVASLRE